jgi:hypothetical protein
VLELKRRIIMIIIAVAALATQQLLLDIYQMYVSPMRRNIFCEPMEEREDVSTGKVERANQRVGVTAFRFIAERC